ncbi:hypothetical protein VTK26DRAFT_6617 [Humicola hyalothermophila]
MPGILPTRYHELGPEGRGEAKHGTTSEAAESLLGSDGQRAWSDITVNGPAMAQRRESRRRNIWKAAMSVRSLVDTLLLLAIFGLLLDRRSPRAALDVGSDLTGFAPRFSHQIKSFSPDPMFAPENGSDFFTEAVQARWLSIVPKGLGYVQINDTQEYDDLPTPLAGYPDSTFTTSATHQLHCLHSLVQTVAAYQSNRPDRLPEDGAWHISHCVDYIRQGIMCCGDVALEGQQTTFPPGVDGSDGWDAKHVCRDWNQVLAHWEANRANDNHWI